MDRLFNPCFDHSSKKYLFFILSNEKLDDDCIPSVDVILSKRECVDDRKFCDL